MRQGRIAVIGSYNRDVGLVVDRFPVPGETIRALSVSESHGGKGSNQALQAAKFGVQVAMVAALGDDAAGQAALSLWRGQEIDVSGAVLSPGQATGAATILVDRSGQNMIVVSAGANAGLDAQRVEGAADLIAGADLVLAQLETPTPATRLAFEIARKQGAATVLNAAPLSGVLVPELLGLVDVLIVNAIEADQLAAQFGFGGDLESNAAQLLQHVAKAVVLTLGGDGALLFEAGQPPRRIPAPEVDLVDSTGAGDAFTGAFCAQWVSTKSMPMAARWGVAAGSFACSGHGAAASYGGPAQIAERHGDLLGS